MKTTTKKKWRISRRGFLIGAGVLGTGVALGYVFGLPAARLQLAGVLDSGVGRAADIEKTPALWVEIAPNNTATFYIPKIEMGQGIHTALAQILADELGVDWQQVHVVQGSTVQGPLDSTGTVGSSSVSSLWVVLREVAANMREMLRNEAATQLNTPIQKISVANGAFLLDGKPAITYGEVVAKKQGAWQAPKETPALKSSSDYAFIGKPMPRVDLYDKIVGTAQYGYDARLPNMLYAAVVQKPTLEATLKSAAVGDADKQPGVAKVLIEGDLVAIAAETRQQARTALGSLALQWNEGKLWQQTEVDALLKFDPRKSIDIQKVGAGSPTPSGNVIEAEYASPFAAHAHLEPQAALADAQGDKVRIWVSTQMPTITRSDVAKAMGMKDEQIEIMPTYLGGGFGRRFGSDAAVAAAKLSKATGRPVHYGWVRKEEFQNGYLRPPTQHILRGALDSNGRIQSLTHLQSSGEVAFSFLPGAVNAVLGADFGAWRGSRFHYDAVPNLYAAAIVAKLPIRTSWWRGLGLLANIFAIESFVDELAHAAKADPLAFRLNHFGNTAEGEKFKRVLNAAAEQAGWGKPLPAGHAQGIAVCTDVGTVCAQVAEVSVDNGKIRVHRVVSAMDPGFIINPDGVRAQTEGAVTMGISSALFEKATIVDGRVSADNFDAYELIRMRDTPKIETVLLQSGNEPKGVGEPPIGPIAAAIGNAVFKLTGKRLRTLPLSL